MTSRSSKVVDFGTNLKRLCGFLLVFNSNLGRILHRFGDMAAYRSKNRQNRPFEPTPVSEIALAGGDPLPCEFFDESYLARIRNYMELSDGEEMMTLALSVLIQYRLTG